MNKRKEFFLARFAHIISRPIERAFVALGERALQSWPMFEDLARIEQELSADGTGTHKHEESAPKTK